jgi:hypothetical protein
MVNNLPDLRILPLNDLILHEDHDRQRTLPLVAKLRAQGILRNPPIVMPLADGTGRYMVLDGANRVTSLQGMEFPHILAQVVPYDDPHVYLGTWNHVVWGLSPRTLLADLRKAEEMELRRINTHKSLTPPEGMPAQIRLRDGSVYLVTTAPDLSSAVAGLHRIVNLYKDRASLDRTSQTLIEGLDDIHPNLTALVIFPRFEVPTVLTLAGRGDLLPTGITRFTVSPRALHLNYPLHELSSGRPIEYKEAYLEHWIQERLKNKGVRHYAEATFLFDE